MKWVVFRENRNGRSEKYWTGNMTKDNRPTESVDVKRALEFDHAATAYALAETFGLWWWRVGKRRTK